MKLLILTNARFWGRSMGSHARLYAIAKHYLARGDQVDVGLLDYMTPPLAQECDLAAAHGQFAILSMTPPSDSRPSYRIGIRQWLANHFKCPPDHGLASWEQILFRIYGHTALLQPRPSHNVQHVRQWLKDKRPDVVMMVYVHTTYLIPVVRASRYKPKLILLDTIDVQSRRSASFQNHGQSHWIDIDAMSELQLADQADIVLAIQDEEARFFREGLKTAETQVLYHSQTLVPLPAIDNTMNVLFVGGGMLPNQMGIQRFLQECWPLIIKQTQGAARLRIVGKVCEELPPLTIPGVTQVGFVADLDAEYREATVVIAPIDFGGGLKIKVVDALCHGKAVVTTPCGAEGLPATPSHAFLIASSSEAMSRSVTDLLLQPEHRKALELRAQEYAQKTFTETACFRALDTRVQQWLQAAPPVTRRKRPCFPENRPRALLFGTGTGGRNGYNYLKTIYRIVGFCDNNKTKHGTVFCGCPVYAPADLKDLSFDRVVICSMHKEAITRQLQSDGTVPVSRIETLSTNVRKGRDWSQPAMITAALVTILLILAAILSF